MHTSIVDLTCIAIQILWRKPAKSNKRGDKYNMRYNNRYDRFEVPGADNGYSDSEQSDEGSPIGQSGRLS